MADFNTHLGGAAITASLFAPSLTMTGLIETHHIALVWLAGLVGGLLPDLDSDSSGVLKGLFTVLGLLAAFWVLVLFSDWVIWQLWLSMLVVYLSVRVGCMEVFKRFTVHRGAMHSVLAALLAGLSVSYGAYFGFLLPLNASWAIGMGMTLGYLTHLVLDELYAVDLSGMELKRSFGSALKLMSLRSYLTSACYLLLAGLIWVRLPVPEQLLRRVAELTQGVLSGWVG